MKRQEAEFKVNTQEVKFTLGWRPIFFGLLLAVMVLAALYFMRQSEVSSTIMVQPPLKEEVPVYVDVSEDPFEPRYEGCVADAQAVEDSYRSEIAGLKLQVENLRVEAKQQGNFALEWKARYESCR